MVDESVFTLTWKLLRVRVKGGGAEGEGGGGGGFRVGVLRVRVGSSFNQAAEQKISRLYSFDRSFLQTEEQSISE